MRMVIALAIAANLCTAETSASQDSSTPLEEDPSTLISPMERGGIQVMGDSRWACMWNNSNYQTLYMSWRFDSSGTTNLSIGPGGSHRLFVGTDDGWVCWAYGSPIGSGCPNASKIRGGWAGNCP